MSISSIRKCLSSVLTCLSYYRPSPAVSAALRPIADYKTNTNNRPTNTRHQVPMKVHFADKPASVRTSNSISPSEISLKSPLPSTSNEDFAQATPFHKDDHKTSTPKGDDIIRQNIIKNGFNVLDLNGQITIDKRATNIPHQVPLTVRFGASYRDLIVNDVPVTKDVFIPRPNTNKYQMAVFGSRDGQITINGKKTKFPAGSPIWNTSEDLEINDERFTDEMFIE